MSNLENQGGDSQATGSPRDRGIMVKRSIRISGLLAALLLLSGQAVAAGLGKMSVMSSLGQPLRAEIELLSVPAEDIGSIEAKLASAEAFRQARLDRSAAVADLQLTVERRPNGQPVVRITSATPVSNPFVDLLIELNWSSGRILREYTVLLDPVRDDKAMAEAPKLAPVLATVAPAAAPRAEAVRTPVPAPGPAAKEAASSYGPVKKGETLRSIASKVLPPDVTLNMMVASLYQANKKAFAQDNLNLLKQGQVLTVPDRESVMLMYSPHQAGQLLKEHATAWHAIQNRLADQAARNVAEPAGDQPGKGKIVPAQPQGTAPAAVAKDVLKLSKGEPAKTADGKSAQRVQALEEEVAAKSRALQESQDKVSQLERTVQDLQRLIQLKSMEAAKQPAAPADAKPEEAAAVPPAPKKPKAAVPVEVPVEQPGFLATVLGNPLYLGGGLAAVVLAGLLWVFMIGSRRRKGLSDFEQSVMTGGDQFKTSIFKTGAGANTERSTVTQSGAATDFSRLGLGSIDTHEVDPIAEAEVYMAYGRDAQAEEILKEALSKDPSRHEIVLKLLEIYATRQDTASFETQASELYANLGDPTSPIWHKAAEMGSKLDPANPLYRVFGEAPAIPEAPGSEAPDEFEQMTAFPEGGDERVSAQAEEAVEAPKGAMDALDFDLAASPELAPLESADATEETEVSALDELTLESELALTPAMPDTELDTAAAYPAFGVTDEPVLEAPAETRIPDLQPEQPLELPEEFGPIDLASETPAAEEAVTMPGVGELGDLPDLDLPPEPEEKPAAPSDKLAELDFSGLDLDLDEPEEIVAQPVAAEPEIEAPSEIDPDLLEEVNTKLDLARAYLEMGDKEGAREILDEVVKEGDAKQKQEADKLIASI